MVLRLKAWESRSLPGLQSPVKREFLLADSLSLATFGRFRATGRDDPDRSLRLRPAPAVKAGRILCLEGPVLRRTDSFDAGWSSPVARQAHNLKVTGSNPVPAPKKPRRRKAAGVFLFG